MPSRTLAAVGEPKGTRLLVRVIFGVHTTSPGITMPRNSSGRVTACYSSGEAKVCDCLLIEAVLWWMSASTLHC